MRLLGAFLFTWMLASCVTGPKPIEEYTLARVALENAKIVESARFSPGYWHQAEESYRKAKELFENRKYEESKLLFNKARSLAEKAENQSRYQKMQTGEVF